MWHVMAGLVPTASLSAPRRLRQFNGVSRAQRSIPGSALRAARGQVTRSGMMRCRPGIVQSSEVWNGPGSAVHHSRKNARAAPHPGHEMISPGQRGPERELLRTDAQRRGVFCSSASQGSSPSNSGCLLGPHPFCTAFRGLQRYDGRSSGTNFKRRSSECVLLDGGPHVLPTRSASGNARNCDSHKLQDRNCRRPDDVTFPPLHRIRWCRRRPMWPGRRKGHSISSTCLISRPKPKSSSRRRRSDTSSGGSGDEWTLKENTRAFNDRQILPRYLAGVEVPSTATEILGSKVDIPVFVPPMAAHGLAHATAEKGSAKGAADAGALFCAQTLASKTSSSAAARPASTSPGSSPARAARPSSSSAA